MRGFHSRVPYSAWMRNPGELARMDTGEAIAQRNTPHKAAQAPSPEAGMTGGKCLHEMPNRCPIGAEAIGGK